MNPRQNQISTVIHHQLQILRFLLLVPSDPLIAWGHLPSRRRPQQTGQYLLSTPPGAHQVAEICSYRHAVRQVVIPLDQLGPQPALAAALDHPQLQWCELPPASRTERSGMSNVTVGQPPRQVPPGARSHAELGAPAERPSLASTTRVSRPPSPPARNPEWLLGSLAPDRESCAGPGHRVIPAKQRRAFCLAAWPFAECW